MHNRKKNLLIILAFIGLVVWFGIGIISLGSEPWDSIYYYIIGLPVMCISSAIAGYFEPEKPAVFGFAVIILQPVALLFQSDMDPLIIVGIIFFVFFSGFTIGSAYIGAAAGKNKLKNQH